MSKENIKFRDWLLDNNKELQIYVKDIDKLSQDEFAEVRHNSFGASDSSKTLGVNPFPGGTKEHLYLEKKERITNDEIGKKATVRMGRDLEDLIIKKAAELTGVKILKPTDMYLNHITGQSVNFDGVSYNDNIKGYIPREIKTVSIFGRKYYNFNKAVNLEETPNEVILHPFIPSVDDVLKFAGEDTMSRLLKHNAEEAGVPVYYYTQLQQQIDMLNAPYGTLTVIDVSTWTVFEFTIERADPVIKKLRTETMFLYMKLQSARNLEKKDGE